MNPKCYKSAILALTYPQYEQPVKNKAASENVHLLLLYSGSMMSLNRQVILWIPLRAWADRYAVFDQLAATRLKKHRA